MISVCFRYVTLWRMPGT